MPCPPSQIARITSFAPGMAVAVAVGGSGVSVGGTGVAVRVGDNVRVGGAGGVGTDVRVGVAGGGRGVSVWVGVAVSAHDNVVALSELL